MWLILEILWYLILTWLTQWDWNKIDYILQTTFPNVFPLTHWLLGDFRELILKLILVNDGWTISCEIVLTWTPQDLTDDRSTLVQVMAWCRQATSHYLSQWWPISLSPYGVTRPQWVNENDCILTINQHWFNGLVPSDNNKPTLTKTLDTTVKSLI